MATLRGLVCNDDNAAAMDILNPQWAHVEFYPGLWDYSNQPNCSWTIHLYEQKPSVDLLKQAMRHSSYSGWWIVGGNEMDLKPNWNADQQAQLIHDQIRLVLKADPQARIVMECGTQYNPIWEMKSWFFRVWKRLSLNDRQHIRALHTHYYAQAEIFKLELAESGEHLTVRERLAKRKPVYDPHDLSNIFKQDPIINYYSHVREGMDDLNLKGLKLFATEIGLAVTPYTEANLALVAQYPKVIDAAMKAVGVQRWAYYIQRNRNDGYYGLQEASGNNAIGQTFASL